MTTLIDPKPFEERFRRGEITQAELDQSAPHSRLASPAAQERHRLNMRGIEDRMRGRMSRTGPFAQQSLQNARARALQEQNQRNMAMQRLRGATQMFGNPYMQRPMFGGGFNPFSFNAQYGGGFNPYMQRSMFMNNYIDPRQQMQFANLPTQQQFRYMQGMMQPPSLLAMGYRPPINSGIMSSNRFQNPMSDVARRQSLMAAMNARAQQQGQAQQARQVPVATGVRGVNTGAADAARAMNQARFMAPQGLGGTAQFQNPTVDAGAADAARAMATAQFSGNPMLQAPQADKVPIANPVMMSTGAGGGIVPQFGLNPMSFANTNPGAGGGIVPQFGNAGTNQPAAGGTI